MKVIGQENAYILCKNKYSHLIQDYNKLLANIDLSFTVGVKPKRGRIPDALKGLKKQ
jgi:hypothetical protein